MANYRFKNVPKVQYNADLITDITHNITIEWTEGNVLFVNYTIQDGDTAENIAYRLWTDSSLSWILCFVNGIIDPFFDWPLRSDELLEFTKNKYGSDNIYATHHYERDGYVVNGSPSDKTVTAVSNFDYEFKKNEEKRDILLPTESFVQQFLSKWGEQ